VSLRSRVPESVKELSRRGVGAAGAATARWHSLPDFLICGAQRCGTTSLYRMLSAHPAVVPPALHKGIHYFDTADAYRRGFRWYRGHFPLHSTMARCASATGGRAVTGEASPYYVFHPLAADRIAAALPEVRLIVLLRDPVERAFSAHKQETARGFEAEPFERALELEPQRLAGEEERIAADPSYQSVAHQHHAYVRRGEYATQLERAFDAVGRDHAIVLDADDLFGGDRAGWHQLLRFLELPVWEPAFVRANARPSAPMPESIRHRLEEHFEPHDEKLAALLGWVPSWRRRTHR
jgi:Sulfotransferase family